MDVESIDSKEKKKADPRQYQISQTHLLRLRFSQSLPVFPGQPSRNLLNASQIKSRESIRSED